MSIAEDTWQNFIFFSPLQVLSTAQEPGGGLREAVVRQLGVFLPDEQRLQKTFSRLLVVFHSDLM